MLIWLSYPVPSERALTCGDIVQHHSGMRLWAVVCSLGLSPALLPGWVGCEGCSVWSCWLCDFSANLCFPASEADRDCFHSRSQFEPCALPCRHASLASIWDRGAARDLGSLGAPQHARAIVGSGSTARAAFLCALLSHLPTTHNY